MATNYTPEDTDEEVLAKFRPLCQGVCLKLHSTCLMHNPVGDGSTLLLLMPPVKQNRQESLKYNRPVFGASRISPARGTNKRPLSGMSRTSTHQHWWIQVHNQHDLPHSPSNISTHAQCNRSNCTASENCSIEEGSTTDQIGIKRRRIICSGGVNPAENHVVVAIGFPIHTTSIIPCSCVIEMHTHLRVQWQKCNMWICTVL
jgi:hypothetical protein